MNNDKEFVTQHDLMTIIEDFISKSAGLVLAKSNEGDVAICQKGDSKKIKVKSAELADVLVRKDADGKEFVQINFASGRKILLTDQLIGFKPFPVADLDVTKLPRVVTTLDLLSVFEAIEEAVTSASDGRAEETETLKRVFNSIILGGEEIGFDLTTERSWIRRLAVVGSKTSA
ncbi:MAG: hypothetical protein SGI74_10045 [Oligoflexia bacterium]|nr:hypothetical protein [Oligoflexia bacterium]